MKVQHITFDCVDPYDLATFWSVALGWPICADDEAGDEAVSLEPPHPAMAELLFLRVSEPKTVKNRMHMDLVPTERTRDEEVARLTAAGAVMVDDRRTPEGRGWVVLADPEGNEFCVEMER